MSSAPAALIATGFLVLAGGAAGFVLGRWSATYSLPDPIRIPEPMRSEPPDLAPLLTEIRQGHDEILRELRERPPSPSVEPSRQPAIDDEKLDRLTAAVEGMAARIEKEVRLQGRGQGYPDLESFATKFRLIEAGVESHESIRADLRAAHIHWSHRDLLDRYGRPATDSFNSENGSTTYDLGPAWLHFNLGRDEVYEVLVVAKQ